jgi:tRNA A-37 threonylcarbamoyl transferase component Bud32/uncharacterized membrane protein
MNSSSHDPFRGHDPADLLHAAALPTGDGTDTPPLDRTDLPTPEEIAAAFPELEILGLIGHGGMSAVFKARQPELDRVVALKVLPKSLAAAPGFTERFNREGRVLARLSHPHIVTVHEFGASGGFAYLIMEHVDGVNLRQAMRAGRFTPEEALGIIPGICDALQFAHTQGVLHRDIKPENILLDTKGTVKIADFGIAKILDEKGGDALLLTRSGAKLGTAPYMAPEQIEQPASVDHRADIYSLGVVFYEMLTGELPLGRFAAPSELASVGGIIDEIVFRALAKERSRRQQSVNEFKTQVAGAGGTPMASRAKARRPGEPFEYRSQRRFCGLPLLHVVAGPDPDTGKIREAHGFFAIGGKARGVFAFGGVARGWFAFGGVAMGLVAFGGLGIGLVSFGGLALGLLLAYGGLGLGTFALGGMVAGYHAVGGMALAWHGVGGMVWAHQGYGGMVRAAEVVEELRAMPRLTQALHGMKEGSGYLFLLWLPVSAFAWSAQAWGRGQAAIAAGSPPDHRVSKRVFWSVPAVSLIGIVWILLVRVLLDAAEPSLETGVPVIPWAVIPSGVTFIGLLFFVLALPLWLRMVPVNEFYGLRIPSTMVSDERWYAANTHVGKVLLIWSLVILGAGLAGFFQLPRHQDSYHWAVLALTVASAVAALVSVFSWLRRHPVNGPERRPSRLAKLSGNVVMAVIVAFFIKHFILEAYRLPTPAEPGVAKDSHWIAWKLDTGFAPGNLVVYEHENGQPWVARVEQSGKDGLVLKRGGRPDAFLVTWDKVIGKLIFSHFTPDTMVRP